MERTFFTSLHTSTKRDYLGRMNDDKVHCMQVARQYGKDFFDGERRYGFGGYRYDGRWLPVAQAMAQTYGLKPGARILEVGCGKGFLLYEFTRAIPDSRVCGFDISAYAIEQSKEEIRQNMFVHKAEDTPWPFRDKEFDFVYSIATLHNLPIFDLARALPEMNRVAKNAYLCVESYRNEQELFNLQCWALTCNSFFNETEWLWIYDRLGYTGDHEFIYF